MSNDKRRFKVGTKVYDIPEEKVEQFIEKAGDKAIEVRHYKVGDLDYDIPIDKEEQFLQKAGDKAVPQFKQPPQEPELKKEEKGLNFWDRISQPKEDTEPTPAERAQATTNIDLAEELQPRNVEDGVTGEQGRPLDVQRQDATSKANMYQESGVGLSGGSTEMLNEDQYNTMHKVAEKKGEGEYKDKYIGKQFEGINARAEAEGVAPEAIIERRRDEQADTYLDDIDKAIYASNKEAQLALKELEDLGPMLDDTSISTDVKNKAYKRAVANYKEATKRNKEVRDSKVKAIDEKIAELTDLLTTEFLPNRYSWGSMTRSTESIIEEIENLETQKKSFFKTPEQAVTELVTEGEVEEEAAKEDPQKVFNDYYQAINEEMAEIYERNPDVRAVVNGDLIRGAYATGKRMLFGDNDQKRWMELQEKASRYAPVALVNQQPYIDVSKDNFFRTAKNATWRSFFNESYNSNELEASQKLLSDIVELNVAEDLSALKSLQKASKYDPEKGYEAYGLEDGAWWGQMTGNSLAMMAELAISAPIAELALGRLLNGQRFFNYARNGGNVAELFNGAKYMNKLASTRLGGKLIGGAVKSGVTASQYQTAGLLFDNGKDELHWLGGMMGSFGEQAVMSLLGKNGKILKQISQQLFKDKTDDFAKIMIDIGKMGSKNVGTGIGEVAEETMQDVAGLWRESNGDFLNQFKERYGNLKYTSELMIGSFVTGMAFGSGTTIGSMMMQDFQKNLAELEKTDPQEAAKVKGIAKEVTADFEKATEAAFDPNKTPAYSSGSKEISREEAIKKIESGELADLIISNDKELEKQLIAKATELQKEQKSEPVAPSRLPSLEESLAEAKAELENNVHTKAKEKILNMEIESLEKRIKEEKAKQKTGQQNEEFFTGKAAEASSTVPYEPVIKIDREAPVTKAYDTYSAGGNFTGHISKMIPGFQEKQIKVADAIVKSGAKSFLDIGASEGGMVKTVASQNPNLRGVALDPNSQMKKNYESTPEVKNAEFKQEGFLGSWTEKDGTFIPEFKPDQKFDVINEDFTFQFISNDRAAQVKGVKEMLADDGVFVTSEKFFTENFDANEEKKADHQSKYFSEADRTKDKEEIITGMADDMVSDEEYLDVLEDQFQYVAEFWNAGNFKGYIASDSKEKLDQFLEAIGDTTTEFTDTGAVQPQSRGDERAAERETEKGITEESLEKEGYNFKDRDRILKSQDPAKEKAALDEEKAIKVKEIPDNLTAEQIIKYVQENRKTGHEEYVMSDGGLKSNAPNWVKNLFVMFGSEKSNKYTHKKNSKTGVIDIYNNGTKIAEYNSGKLVLNEYGRSGSETRGNMEGITDYGLFKSINYAIDALRERTKDVGALRIALSSLNVKEGNLGSLKKAQTSAYLVERLVESIENKATNSYEKAVVEEAKRRIADVRKKYAEYQKTPVKRPGKSEGAKRVEQKSKEQAEQRSAVDNKLKNLEKIEDNKGKAKRYTKEDALALIDDKTTTDANEVTPEANALYDRFKKLQDEYADVLDENGWSQIEDYLESHRPGYKPGNIDSKLGMKQGNPVIAIGMALRASALAKTGKFKTTKEKADKLMRQAVKELDAFEKSVADLKKRVADRDGKTEGKAKEESLEDIVRRELNASKKLTTSKIDKKVNQDTTQAEFQQELDLVKNALPANVPLTVSKTEAEFNEELAKNGDGVKSSAKDGITISGFYDRVGKRIVLNGEALQKGLAIHEIAHIILDTIKASDAELYWEIEEAVKSDPILSKYYDYAAEHYSQFGEAAVLNEALTHLIQAKGIDELNKLSAKDQQNVLKKIWELIKKILGIKGDKIVDSDGNIIVSGEDVKNPEAFAVNIARAILSGNKLNISVSGGSDTAFSQRKSDIQKTVDQLLSDPKKYGETFNNDGTIYNAEKDGNPDVVSMASVNVSPSELNADTINDFRQKYSRFFDNPHAKVGVFRMEDGNYSIDANIVIDKKHRANTKKFAKDNNQEAIYSYATDELIDTGGDGNTVITSQQEMEVAAAQLVDGKPFSVLKDTGTSKILQDLEATPDLTKGKKKARPIDVAAYLEQRTIEQQGAADLKTDPASRVLRAVQAGIREIGFMLEYAKESGIEWYVNDIINADRNILKVFPELADKSAMRMFKGIMAITSSGNNPRENAKIAANLWEKYRENKFKSIPRRQESKSVVLKNGKSYTLAEELKTVVKVWKGKRVVSIDKSKVKSIKNKGWTLRPVANDYGFERLESLINDLGLDKAMEFMTSKQRVEDIRKYKEDVPDLNGGKGKVRYGKNDMRYGAFMLGEKLGSYFLNLNDIHEETTVDLWAMRTWNRWMGTMFEEVTDPKTGELVNQIKETPRTEGERAQIREAFNKLGEIYKLSPAELQAILWFYEQNLYRKLGSDTKSYTYNDGTKAVLEQRGIKPDKDVVNREETSKRRKDALSRAISKIGFRGKRSTSQGSERSVADDLSYSLKKDPKIEELFDKLKGQYTKEELIDAVYNVTGISKKDLSALYGKSIKGKTAQRLEQTTEEHLKELRKDIKDNPESIYNHNILSTDLAEEYIEAQTTEQKIADVNAVKHIWSRYNENPLLILQIGSIIGDLTRQGKHEEAKIWARDLNALGTPIGTMLNHFSRLKNLTAESLVEAIAVNLANDPNFKKPKDKAAKEFDTEAIDKILTKTQKERLLKRSEEYRQAQEEYKAAKKALAEDVKSTEELKKRIKEFDKAKRALAQAHQNMANDVNRLKPKGIADTFVQIMQGGALTIKSLIVNPVANFIFVPIKMWNDFFGDVVNTIWRGVKGQGWDFPYFGAVVWNTAAHIQGGVDVWSDVYKGNIQGSYEKLDIRHNINAFQVWSDVIKGLMGDKSGMEMWQRNAKTGKIKTSVLIEKVLEGTAGMNADIMFRGLHLGDKSFRKGGEAGETYRIAKEKKVKIKSLKDLARFQATLSKNELERIKQAGNRSVFAEKRALSSGGLALIELLNKGIEKMDGSPYYTVPLKSLAKMLVKSQSLFVTIPLNLIEETLLYAIPVLNLAGAAHSLSTGNPQAAGRYIGRIFISAALYSLGNILYEADIISVIGQEDDDSAKALKHAAGKRNGINRTALARLLMGGDPAFQEGDKIDDFGKLGIPGMFLGYYVEMMNELKRRKIEWNFFDPEVWMVSSLAAMDNGMNQSFMQGAMNIAQAINNKDIKYWAAGTMRTMTGVVIPNNWVNSVVKPNREFMIDAKDEDLTSWMRKDFEAKWKWNDIEGSAPYVDVWGQMVTQFDPDMTKFERFLHGTFNLLDTKTIKDPKTIALLKFAKINEDESIAQMPSNEITLPVGEKEYIDKDGNKGTKPEPVTIKLRPEDHKSLQLHTQAAKASFMEDLMSDPSNKNVKNVYNENNYVGIKKTFSKINGMYRDIMFDIIMRRWQEWDKNPETSEWEFDLDKGTYKKRVDKPIAEIGPSYGGDNIEDF